MSLTDVEICQKALALIGANTIQSLDDGSDLAQLCSTLYEDLKQSALAEHHWNFATKKRELAQDSNSPPTEWDHQYTLPSDLIRGPTKVFADDNSQQPIQDWKKVNNKIMTDNDTIYIDYVADVDETKFPPHFVRFLYHALASELAITVTDQVNMAELYERKAYGLPSDAQEGGLLQKARHIDSLTQSTQTIDDNPIDDARFGAGHSGTR